MRIKDFKAALLIFPIVVLSNLSNIIILFSGESISADPSFSNLFFSSLFNGVYQKDNSTLSLTMFGLIPQMFFNILYGTYIYRDLHISQTYFFIRQNSKKKWYIKCILRLALIELFYVFIQVSLPALFAVANCNEVFSTEHIFKIIVSYVSLFMFTVISTLIVNILSLFCGSAISFFITYIYIIGAYYTSLKIDYITILDRKIDVSCLNIIDTTIFNSSKSNYPQVGLLIDFIYIIIISAVGYAILRNYDLSIKDKEI